MTGSLRYRMFMLAYAPHGADLGKRQQFEAAVRKTPGWAKYFASTWFLATSETPKAIWQRLEPHVNPQDYVLIIEIRENYFGRLPTKAWEWFRSVQQVNDAQKKQSG